MPERREREYAEASDEQRDRRRREGEAGEANPQQQRSTASQTYEEQRGEQGPERRKERPGGFEQERRMETGSGRAETRSNVGSASTRNVDQPRASGDASSEADAGRAGRREALSQGHEPRPEERKKRI